jgi:hypothetical protein
VKCPKVTFKRKYDTIPKDGGCGVLTVAIKIDLSDGFAVHDITFRDVSDECVQFDYIPVHGPLQVRYLDPQHVVEGEVQGLRQ